MELIQHKKVYFLFAITFCLFTTHLSAQDLHFSQFTMTPLQLDPSQAGKFEGDQRAIINYREQWKSVAFPYKTYGFSFDTKINSKKQKDNFFGAGISVYSDKAGDINLGFTTVNVSIAYHVRLNKQSFLSAGLQGGFLNSSLNETKLRFDNQFDGSGHNDAFSSGEVFESTSFFAPDFSSGISYSFSDNTSAKVISNNGFDGKKINIGFALHHVANSNYSFLENNSDKLNFKYVLHSFNSFGIASSNLAIQPSGFVAFQANALDIVVGTYFRYNLKEKSKFTQFSDGVALSLGIHYRLNDAFIPSALIEFGSFALGVSYDINTSGLTSASNGNGGFEISIRYTNPNPFASRKSSARFH